MFVFAVILLLIAVTIGIVSRFAHPLTENQRRDERFDIRKWSGISSAALVGLAALITVLNCWVIVPNGSVGVPVVFGDVQHTYIPAGLRLKAPWMDVTMMNVQTQTYTMSSTPAEGKVQGDDAIQIMTKDQLVIPIDVSIPHRLSPELAWWVLKNIGQDYENVVIRPSAQTGVREGFARFNFDELNDKNREVISAAMYEMTMARIQSYLADYPNFKGHPFIVAQVMMRHVEPPAKVKIAIEDKQEAEQQMKKMFFTVQRESLEAKRKAVEAQGIAEFQRIVTAGISEPLLKWKGIEATEKLAASPNSKVVIIGGGRDGLPIILNGDSK